MRIEIYVKNSDVDRVFKSFEQFLKKHPIKENNIGLKRHCKLHQKYYKIDDIDYRQIVNLNINDLYLDMVLKIIIELFKNDTDIRIAFKYYATGDNIFINQEEVENFMNSHYLGGAC